MNQPITPTPTLGNWRPSTTEPRAIVSDCDCAAVDCRSQLLCRSYGGHIVATTIRNLGDIPLIAAAPKLLAACEAALAKLTGDGLDGTLGHHPDNPVPAQLRAAIAIAETKGKS